MDSFYITLPSNDPSYANNKTSHFTVRLPETLELDNSWTVSMSSIIYPISFASLGAEDEQYAILTYLDENDNQQHEKITIPSLNFHTIKEMENTLNTIIRQHLIQRSIKFGTTKLGGDRSARSVSGKLTPIEESEEIQEKLRNLKERGQQKTTSTTESGNTQSNITGQSTLSPISESAENERKKEKLQLDFAKELQRIL